jgi:hypothetical protein
MGIEVTLTTFTLKSMSPYDYIQNTCFPRQVFRQKVFPFKMLINGRNSELDLVVWMQLDHDLQSACIMFDH